MAFKEFGHIFWGATKPVIIMTDSKSVTRFFQTKMIPPPLCNACDFVLQFNFTIAHIPGKKNTAADSLSRLEMDPNEKIILKIREDIPTKPIEVNIESTGIAQETKSVLSSKMTSSIYSTITTLVKSVTYRSFCPDNYSKCYHNQYMEQLANTQVFQK